jgi:hypothetical protein
LTITINSSPAQVSGPVVELELSDSGSAHVSFTIFIPGVTPTPLQWDETFVGSKTFSLPMQVGTYKCVMMIGAFDTNNALGPVYRSQISLNGLPFASAKGKVPKKDSSDFGDKIETITVV